MTHIHGYSDSPLVPAFAPVSVTRVRSAAPFSQKQIMGATAIAVVLVNLVALMLYLCIKRRFCGIKMRPCPRKGKSQAWKIDLRRFQLTELEKSTSNFSQECKVGSGAFGNVYKGVLEREGPIAIKRARADSYQSVQEFRNEVELLSKVKHKNLLGLVGFCEESGQKMLVYEYVPNGSLLDYIIGRKGKTLTWRQRVKIAIGAAKGVAHLHEGVKPSIIHRDIKPSNILVGDGFEAKVSDFGLVRSGPVGDASHVSSQIKGTPGYLDPAYCTSLHLTPFSDVYSFGVILLQLVTGRPAVDTTCRSSSQFHIIDWARPSLEQGKVEDIIDANLLVEPCNMEMMLKMGKLGLQCVEPTPRQRPTMAQVFQELEEALYSFDGLNQTHSLAGSFRSTLAAAEMEQDDYQSYVSVDGVGLQKFYIDMDSVSFQSTSMRRFEINSVSVDIDRVYELGAVSEEAGAGEVTSSRHTS